jgi:hypothetical protein
MWVEAIQETRFSGNPTYELPDIADTRMVLMSISHRKAGVSPRTTTGYSNAESVSLRAPVLLCGRRKRLADDRPLRDSAADNLSLLPRSKHCRSGNLNREFKRSCDLFRSGSLD